MKRHTEVSTEDVVATYRWYAPLYDRLFGLVLEPGRRALAHAVDEVQPATLLEVGVGTGLVLPRYPAHSKVVGIDLSADMLEVARRKVASLTGRRIELQVMNAEQLDFPDATFDCVTVPYVLSVTPDPDRFVSEIRRVCKPGGIIIIVNHFSGSRFWWLLEKLVQPLADRIGFRSEFSFERHITSHDWTVLGVKGVNLLGLSRLVVLRNG